METIAKSWRGSEPLWRVFWIYGVFVGLSFSLVGALLIWQKLLILQIPLTVIYLGYLVWFYVSAWRCAFNCKSIIWGYITRILVALSIVAFLLEPLLKNIDH